MALTFRGKRDTNLAISGVGVPINCSHAAAAAAFGPYKGAQQTNYESTTIRNLEDYIGVSLFHRALVARSCTKTRNKM